MKQLASWLRWSWQNLNEGGSAWHHGRAWLRIGLDAHTFLKPWVVRFEWSHQGHSRTDFALKWTSWSWRNWQCHVELLGLSWFLTFGENDTFGGAETGFYLFGDHFNVFFRHRDSNGMGKDSGWRRSWFVLDRILGRAVHTKGPIQEKRVLVPMPERVYRGVCKLHTDTWKRPRWFTKRIALATIDMEPGEQVPHPGKGESSWDCGEDATWGISLPAKTHAEAVGGLVTSVLRSRERHGGLNWRPQAGKDVYGRMRTALNALALEVPPAVHADVCDAVLEAWHTQWTYAGRRDRDNMVVGMVEIDPTRPDLPGVLTHALSDLGEVLLIEIGRERQRQAADQPAKAAP